MRVLIGYIPWQIILTILIQSNSQRQLQNKCCQLMHKHGIPPFARRVPISTKNPTTYWLCCWRSVSLNIQWTGYCCPRSQNETWLRYEWSIPQLPWGGKMEKRRFWEKMGSPTCAKSVQRDKIDCRFNTFAVRLEELLNTIFHENAKKKFRMWKIP